MNEERAKEIARLREARLKYATALVDGDRIMIPRAGHPPIDVILYRPADIAGRLPVMLELHGGGWLGGDAALMNSFCRDMAERIPAVVINVNYKKLDEQPFPYQQQEVRDTVCWLKENSRQMNINADEITICGQSAGAHICAGAAILMKREQISIHRQILVYPFLDFTYRYDADNNDLSEMIVRMKADFFPECELTDPLISPGLADENLLKGLAPAVMVICGPDPLAGHAYEYEKRLKAAGVPAAIKMYPEAVHGFLETNRIEKSDDLRNSPAQDQMARDCEQYLVGVMKE